MHETIKYLLLTSLNNKHKKLKNTKITKKINIFFSFLNLFFIKMSTFKFIKKKNEYAISGIKNTFNAKFINNDPE